MGVNGEALQTCSFLLQTLSSITKVYCRKSFVVLMTKSVSYSKLQNVLAEIFGQFQPLITISLVKNLARGGHLFCFATLTLSHQLQFFLFEIASLTYEIANHIGSNISELHCAQSRATTHAACRRIDAGEHMLRSLCRSCEFCSEKSGTGTGVFPEDIGPPYQL